jgi:hypothetical protein
VNKKLMRRDKPQTIPASQLFTGAPVFSGAASFTGNPTFSGSPAVTGTATFSGGLVTGSASTNTLNGTTTVGASAVLNLTANYQSALQVRYFLSLGQFRWHCQNLAAPRPRPTPAALR